MKNFIVFCFCFLSFAAKAQEQKKYYLISDGFSLKSYEGTQCQKDSIVDVITDSTRISKFYYTYTIRKAFINGELKSSVLGQKDISSTRVENKVDIYSYIYHGVGYNGTDEDLTRKYGRPCTISAGAMDTLIQSQNKTLVTSFIAVGLDFSVSQHSRIVETCIPLDLNVFLNLPSADNPFSDKWFARSQNGISSQRYVKGSVFSSKFAGSFLVGLDLNLNDLVEMLPYGSSSFLRREKLNIEIPLTVRPSAGLNVTAGDDMLICFFSERDNKLSNMTLNGHGEHPTNGVWSVEGADPRAVKVRGSDSFLDKDYLKESSYILSYKGFYNNGCQFETKKPVRIGYYPLGIKNLSLKSTPYDTGLVALYVAPSIVPDDYFQEYIWRINDEEISKNCPRLVYPFYAAGTQKIELQGIVNNGCRYTMTYDMIYSPEQTDAYKPSEDFLSLIETEKEEE